MNKVFHIELDDYAKPSIVSFGKSYFGTMDDIEEFISKFDDEDDNELVKAFEEYKNGNEDVKQLLLEFMGACISNVKGWRMKKSLFLVGDGNTVST